MSIDDLKNRMISIQVNEPWDWKYGILTGRISEIDYKRLTISLTKSIKGNKFRSNKLAVSARYEGDSIETLIKERSLIVGGALIKAETGETDYVLIGTLKL